MLDEQQRYANQIQIELPEWSTERARRIKEGMSTCVCIDPCIVEDIQFLWESGIETLNSCCGHNCRYAWVAVPESCYEKMKGLGYRQHPEKEWIFILFDLNAFE